MNAPVQAVLAEVKDGVGRLTISSLARHNALTLDMWQALGDRMAMFDADPDVRVIVLTGEGEKSFCVGADISEFEAKRATKEQAEHYEHVVETAMMRIQACRKPTIAMINGYCIGGGVEVAMSCDLRIASTEARFGVPAARLGIGYAYWAVSLLSDLIGPAAAKEIFYTARQFNAEEGLRMRFFQQVLAPADLAGFVDGYCRQIAVNAPLSMASAKRCITEHLKDADQQNRAAALQTIEDCALSEDYAEGRRAFMEKRKPVFRGR